jgi:hypothetical protein
VDVPNCKLCNAEQSFYFQVAFPQHHAWAGRSLAVFSCVACVDEEHLIPEMLDGPLRGAQIPENFLKGYQRNFTFVVFDTGTAVPRSDYVEKVAFKSIDLIPAADEGTTGNKIGGLPNWLLEDESPGLYAGTREMSFLMQIEADTQFQILKGAPHQMELDLGGRPRRTTNEYYQLFNGNWIYLFGTDGLPLVYAITQA